MLSYEKKKGTILRFEEFSVAIADYGKFFLGIIRVSEHFLRNKIIPIIILIIITLIITIIILIITTTIPHFC